MNSFLLHIIKIINLFIPETRFFELKKAMYNFAGANIGNNVRICSSARIIGNGSLIIGPNTWVGPEVMIVSSSHITIGANVDIAPRVFIGTGTHDINLNTPGIAGKGINKNIKISDGCWLGVGSVVLPGVKLGYKCIVAAGAVISKDVVDYSMVGGVPAKFIKNLKENVE